MSEVNLQEIQSILRNTTQIMVLEKIEWYGAKRHCGYLVPTEKIGESYRTREYRRIGNTWPSTWAEITE